MLAMSSITFGLSKTEVFNKILSDPLVKKYLASDRLFIPPPTVIGMKQSFDIS